MKAKPFWKPLIGLLAIMSALGVPAHSAIILMGQTSVTLDGNVPTATGVNQGLYSPNETTAVSPSSVHFNGKFWLYDTVAETVVQTTAVTGASFTLGKSSPGTFLVTYNAVYSSPGSGSPEFSTWNGSTNTSVVSNPIPGATPSGTTSWTVTNQTIPGSFAGGAYNPSMTNEQQTGTFNVTLAYAGGSVSGSFMSAVTFVPEPSAALLLVGCAMPLFRRRRPAAPSLVTV